MYLNIPQRVEFSYRNNTMGCNKQNFSFPCNNWGKGTFRERAKEGFIAWENFDSEQGLGV